MSTFQFKTFSINQTHAALKVGTDSMVLGALIDCHNKTSALDIGTGTSVLAMMQAQKNPNLIVTAIEIDESSCIDANYNIDNGPFSDRIKLIQSDFLSYNFKEKFDLIFSNPPFYLDALTSTNDRTNQAKHVSDLNPQSLFQKVSDLLKENGDFWLIWPYEFRQKLISAALKLGFNLKNEITLEGKPGIPVRSVLSFSKQKLQTVYSQKIVIRDERNSYTDQYKELTKDFHNKEL